MRDKNSKVEKLMISLSKERNVENLIVTMGNRGSVLYNKKTKKFFSIDAYAKKVLDKIGAGDTMLAMIGLSLKIKLDSDLSL